MASDTLEAAVLRLKALEDALSGDWTQAGHAVGAMAKREAKAAAAEATGGSGVLTHMGRGARLSSGYDLDNQGKRLTLKLRPPGPWVIMEQGAKAHVIPKSSGRRRGRGKPRGARYLLAPGYSHPVKAPIHHPGMRQKRGAIRKTFARVRDKASPMYHDEMVKKLAEIYG